MSVESKGQNINPRTFWNCLYMLYAKELVQRGSFHSDFHFVWIVEQTPDIRGKFDASIPKYILYLNRYCGHIISSTLHLLTSKWHSDIGVDNSVRNA